MSLNLLYARTNGTDKVTNGIYGPHDDAEFQQLIDALNTAQSDINAIDTQVAAQRYVLWSRRYYFGSGSIATTSRDGELANRTQSFGSGAIANNMTGDTFPYSNSTIFTAPAGGEILQQFSVKYGTGPNPGGTSFIYVVTESMGAVFSVALTNGSIVGTWYPDIYHADVTLTAGSRYQITCGLAGGHKNVSAKLTRVGVGDLGAYKNIPSFHAPSGGLTIASIQAAYDGGAGGITGDTIIGIVMAGETAPIMTVTIPEAANSDIVYESTGDSVDIDEGDGFSIVCVDGGGHKGVNVTLAGIVKVTNL